MAVVFLVSAFLYRPDDVYILNPLRAPHQSIFDPIALTRSESVSGQNRYISIRKDSYHILNHDVETAGVLEVWILIRR